MKIQRRWIPILIWFIAFILTHWWNYFYVGQAIMALPLFALGYFTKDKILSWSKTMNRKWVLLVPIFAVIVNVIGVFNGELSFNYAQYGGLRFPINFSACYISGITGSAMIMLVAFLFQKGNNIIKTTADSLITILGIQWPFVLICKHFYHGDSLFVMASLAVVITIICCLFHLIISHFAPWIIGKRK